MPVAVDRALDMGALEAKTVAEVHVVEVPPDTPQKTPRAKRKAKAQAAVQEQPLAGTSSAVDEPASTWTWKSLTESSASKVVPIFTKDGSYFLSAAGPAVKIYSVATGSLVSTLSPLGTSSRPAQPTGYGDAVTAMALNPHNAFQLYTGSLDGCIRVWDLVDAIILQTIDAVDPIYQLAVHEKFKNEVYISVSRRTKKINGHGKETKEDNMVVRRVSLLPNKSTAGLSVQTSSAVRKVGKTRMTFGLAFSPSGSWLVAIGGHKAYVAKTAELKGAFTKLVSPDSLTCLAFHPSEEYFATGDAKGVVRLWYCLNDTLPTDVVGVERKAPTTTMHWHAHPITSIAFTSNGAYLLTGGEEAVLVVWRLHTGKREFVPRIGAPITSITVSTSKSAEEKYLLGLADASFVFIRSGTLRMSKSIARVKLDPFINYVRPKAISVPLATHPLSSSLVLPSSHPSILQTYSPITSTLLSELEVSPANKVSRREEEPLEPCCVEMACASDDGNWLATVDSRQGPEAIGAEIYLKIWSWDRNTKLWTLNTRVDRPHGLRKVTSISFRPHSKDASRQLVSTGGDRSIKVWGIKTTQSKSGQDEAFWVARSTTRFRSEIPSNASWSLDGSLLAVALGPYAVLYDPSTMLVVKTLTCPECPVVLSAQFVGKGGRYLTLSGHRDLVLWDLITDTVKWEYSSASGLASVFPHHRVDTFVVFEWDTKGKTRVSKFNVDSATPVATHVLPFELQNVVPCPGSWMLSKDVSSFTFVGITSTWNAVLFGDQMRLAENDLPEKRGLGSMEQVTKQTLFQDIFGRMALPQLVPPPSVHSTSTVWKGKEVEKVFDTPAYLMPPLATLFDSLMGEFLAPRPPEISLANEDEADLQNEDEMEAEGSQNPIIVGNRLERIVDETEMKAMVELFQAHAVNPSASPSVAPLTNGHSSRAAKVNGVPSSLPATPKIGTSVPKRQSLTNGTTPVKQATTASPLAESTAVKTGQKRKKSLS